MSSNFNISQLEDYLDVTTVTKRTTLERYLNCIEQLGVEAIAEGDLIERAIGLRLANVAHCIFEDIEYDAIEYCPVCVKHDCEFCPVPDLCDRWVQAVREDVSVRTKLRILLEIFIEYEEREEEND